MVRRRRLVFKEEYWESISLGRKVSTVRLNSPARVGDVVDIVAGRKYVGVAVVTGVEVKKVSQLTEEDAKLDGFDSREELVAKLREIYGKAVTDSTEVKIVRFKLLGR
jgi:hypothetical protein